MKSFLCQLVLICLFPIALSAQNPSSPNEAELQRIREISRYSSMESFVRARDLNREAKKGDLVVLQDESRKLYYGIIDTVRSPSSIIIILYNEQNVRELAEATYDDIHYLKVSQPDIRKKQWADETNQPDYALELMKRDNLLKNQEQKLIQMSELIGSAGRSYETADILIYVSIGGLFVGSIMSAFGGLYRSNQVAAIGAAVGVGSLGCSIGTIVYRFRGHQRLKDAGRVFRK